MRPPAAGRKDVERRDRRGRSQDLTPPSLIHCFAHAVTIDGIFAKSFLTTKLM
jgi:hypothetical protein